MMELVDMPDLGAVTTVKKFLKNSGRVFPLLIYAGMMKLVNMLDLGSSAARLVGSSPTTRTMASVLIVFEKL